MIANIHHNFEQKSNRIDQQYLIIAAAIAALVIMIGGMGLAYSVSSMGGSLTPVNPVARPLDEVGFGSARTLLIASMEPEVQVIVQPAASCSPFGSLTACAADNFAGLMRLKSHAPA